MGLDDQLIVALEPAGETSIILGDVLGSANTHLAGVGTHVFDSKICASIAGSVKNIPAASRSDKPVLTISRGGLTRPSHSPHQLTTLPSLNSTVLCRVTRVQQRQASTLILLVQPSTTMLVPDSLMQPTMTTASAEDIYFSAVLRREDVRLTEKDKVVMNDSFRVGDIIRATVISLGDEKNYYISTGGNEFGVAIARSEAGNPMVPTSWKEMRDVVTVKTESRKVAKPI